jgi:hypothetical protein
VLGNGTMPANTYSTMPAQHLMSGRLLNVGFVLMLTTAILGVDADGGR